MKYLAILKDSLREAIDSKVFYVMFFLSGLVILVVASISYRPVTVEDEVTRFTERATWLFGRLANQPGQSAAALHWSVVDFRQTRGTPDQPWDGDYRFSIVVEFPQAQDAEKFRKDQVLPARDVQTTLRQQFRYLNHL